MLGLGFCKTFSLANWLPARLCQRDARRLESGKREAGFTPSCLPPVSACFFPLSMNVTATLPTLTMAIYSSTYCNSTFQFFRLPESALSCPLRDNITSRPSRTSSPTKGVGPSPMELPPAPAPLPALGGTRICWAASLPQGSVFQPLEPSFQVQSSWLTSVDFYLLTNTQMAKDDSSPESDIVRSSLEITLIPWT